MDPGTVAAAILVVLVAQHTFEAIRDNLTQWLRKKSKPWTLPWLGKLACRGLLAIPAGIGRIWNGVRRDFGGGSSEIRDWWGKQREKWETAGGGSDDEPDGEVEIVDPPSPPDPPAPPPGPPPAPTPPPVPGSGPGPLPPMVSDRAGYSETMAILRWIMTTSETAENLGWATAAAVARSEVDARVIAAIGVLADASSIVWDSAKYAVDTLEERHGAIVGAVADSGAPMADPGFYEGGSRVGPSS